MAKGYCIGQHKFRLFSLELKCFRKVGIRVNNKRLSSYFFSRFSVYPAFFWCFVLSFYYNISFNFFSGIIEVHLQKKKKHVIESTVLYKVGTQVVGCGVIFRLRPQGLLPRTTYPQRGKAAEVSR